MKQDIQDISEDFTLIKQWIGQLLTCEKRNGKTFVAKLVAIRGDKLFFESNKGHLMMDKIDHLVFIGPKDSYIEYKEFLEDMDSGYLAREALREDAQTTADVEHITRWVVGEKKAGRTPTDAGMLAELERYVSNRDTLITYDQAEAAARARKGL